MQFKQQKCFTPGVYISVVKRERWVEKCDEGDLGNREPILWEETEQPSKKRRLRGDMTALWSSLKVKKNYSS